MGAVREGGDDVECERLGSGGVWAHVARAVGVGTVGGVGGGGVLPTLIGAGGVDGGGEWGSVRSLSAVWGRWGRRGVWAHIGIL